MKRFTSSTTKQASPSSINKPFLLAAALAWAPGPAWAEGPAFADVFQLDAEYELDRFMGEFPWDGRDRFRAADTAFQTTGGSLNIRHFYIREDLKVRFPLREDRLWFRLRQTRHQGLERDDRDTLLEFEYAPVPGWRLSLLGEHTRHKSDTRFGAAARWGGEERRSLKASYLWPDFDTNKAFKNTSVNEGRQSLYRRFPQEVRLAGTWIGDGLGLFFSARHRRPWEREDRSLSPGGDVVVSRGTTAEAEADLRWRVAGWTVGWEGEAWRDRESVDFEPARSAADRELVQERHAARVALRRDLSPAWRVRLGGGFAAARGRLRFPAAPDLRRGYKTLDRIFYIYVENPVSPRFTWDWGYLYDRQRNETLSLGVPFSESRSQNRGKAGFQYGFSERAFLRALAAVELDPGESETFVSFDGGTMQFQVTY